MVIYRIGIFTNEIFDSKFYIWENINVFNFISGFFVRETFFEFFRTIKIFFLYALISFNREIICNSYGNYIVFYCFVE